ncbi:MAG: tryptophan-rich sensory protein [Syntrophomonadaceae bacterium]
MAKIFAYVSALAYILMVGINAIANILPLNNLTTSQVSGSLHLLFVPAGWAFFIWGLIYLLLAGFVYYLFSTPEDFETTRPVSILFIISCFLNAAWIVAWHYLRFGWSLIILLALLLTLVIIYHRLDHRDFIMPTFKEKYMLILPFAIYSAWVAVASLAHLNINLKLLAGSGFEMVAAMISLGIAVAICSLVLAVRRDHAWGLVFMWALAGIAWQQRAYPLLFIAAGVGVLVIAAVMIQVYLNSRRSFF